MAEFTRYGTAREEIFHTEHYAASVFAIVALALGAIGMLRGFRVLGDVADDVGASGQTTAVLTRRRRILGRVAGVRLCPDCRRTSHRRAPRRDNCRAPCVA